MASTRLTRIFSALVEAGRGRLVVVQRSLMAVLAVGMLAARWRLRRGRFLT